MEMTEETAQKLVEAINNLAAALNSIPRSLQGIGVSYNPQYHEGPRPEHWQGLW
jgi:hypothetical protein